MKNAGLYIHIPFCAGKCPYCAFYSATAEEAQLDRYTDAVIKAIALYPTDFNAETVYFGGGTPGIMGADRLCLILDAAKNRFGSSQTETTVEANPCSVDLDTLKKLRNGGFDRISFGVQSMKPELLKTLGRRHTAEQAKNIILMARQAGFKHISADLMLALPGQTLEDIRSSIIELSALPIDHLSAYILKIEEGTVFYNLYPDPDDDFAADCYAAMQAQCEQLGFKQYEISNFAKNEAAQGKHNLGYWRCREYLGIGPSAHSFMEGRRFYFEGDTDSFIAAKDPWQLVVDDGEGGSDEERLMLGLRLSEGVDLSAFDDGFKRKVLCRSTPYISAGLMNSHDNRLFITPKGYIVSNSLIAAII